MSLALTVYIIFAVWGLVMIWLHQPGTMFVLGAALLYDLFSGTTFLAWHVYLGMIVLFGLGEFFDVAMSSYWKKSENSVAVMKTIIAVTMIAIFLTVI